MPRSEEPVSIADDVGEEDILNGVCGNVVGEVAVEENPGSGPLALPCTEGCCQCISGIGIGG